MARYTIAGVIHTSPNTSGLCVDIVTSSYVEFDRARQGILNFPVYDVICCATEGATLMRKHYVKSEKAI